MNKQTEQQVAAGFFILWMVLLLPWFFFAAMSGMAFDAGPTFAAYALVFSVWTYPISVLLVWRYRDDKPTIAFLPFLNIAGSLLVGLF